jgi:hypothetical protein
MSKRKISALILMASGSMMALGCSIIPFRIDASIASFLGRFGLGG